MSERKLEFWLPKKRFFKSGNADFVTSFPSRIMRAFGWEMNEEVELVITPEEIRITRAKTIKDDKQNKR